MSFYKNKRIIYDPITDIYYLGEITYDKIGVILEGEGTDKLGSSLEEVKELLESLLNDIENWELEELVAGNN